MRFLFLVLTLLGLVSYGDSMGTRTAPKHVYGHRSAATAPQTSSVDTVVISDDGTPVPRFR